MYREKLTEQLELLEDLQKACVVIDEAISLSRCILDISKELDDIQKYDLRMDVPDGETLYETVRNFNKHRNTADPLETMKQAFKETLDNNKD